MPRPSVDLDPHRSALTGLLEEGATIEDLLQFLQSEHTINISRPTLYRRLQAWNLLRQSRTQNTEHLQVRVRQLFFEYGLSDDEIHAELQREGLTATSWGILCIRRTFGLFRRRTPAQIDALQQEAREFFETQQHVDAVVRSYGKEHLYTYLRQRQVNISRNSGFEVYKEFYQDEVNRRRQRVEYRRSGWTTRGPNFVWSIDGYCKLSTWGFEIYAGIDAYSRYITWFSAGVEAHTSLAVLAQYVYIVEQYGYIPQILRADRGKETPLACGAHFWLSSSQRTNLVRDEVTGLEQASPVTFRDCVIYGKSTKNIKIESWWGRLSDGRSHFWRVLPSLLQGWHSINPRQRRPHVD